jgi:hypothetical protein
MSALDGVNKIFCDANQKPTNSNSVYSCILTSGQSIGFVVSVLSSIMPLILSHLQLAAEASFLSFGAIIVIFILIVVCSISFLLCCPISQIPLQRNLFRYRKTLPNGDSKLLRTPADICMVGSIVLLLLTLSLILPVSQLSLFVYDLLLAIAGVLDIRWAHDGIVTTGPYCTAQGVIKQIGGTGAALINLVCIVYSFSVH